MEDRKVLQELNKVKHPQWTNDITFYLDYMTTSKSHEFPYLVNGNMAVMHPVVSRGRQLHASVLVLRLGEAELKVEGGEGVGGERTEDGNQILVD